ncbi:N-acetylglucosaminyl-phosphatidylinositol de-N-acetylase isoform X2 [Cucumis sativus]|uniref:N-acetylglucosaminylphosphatidylinositol deacetylase n=1 Tax=Cucumis sativus TaxID=3659 RepID=A0A0A0LP92_CUCSA|nr:N-acetylglucosaminyl-phosphatidylinositol de-N-acetylase isoform X2 [Cucumis sativus]KGN63715.1 hypothetical protein Csa_013659 [Cucumis sativus]
MQNCFHCIPFTIPFTSSSRNWISEVEIGSHLMGWFLVISALVVIWIASLCKIFSSYSSGGFLNDVTPQKRNILLVIAHPDDESMFFSPTINFLTSRGHKLHILCMSIGNADGMGTMRREELYKASTVLKVPPNQLKILDHPGLQDGFGKVWDHKLLAEIIEQEISSHAIDLIITFDSYGVSGHCNHRDVHNGVRDFLHNKAPQSFEAWELVSTNILRKYSGPIDIWLSILFSEAHTRGITHCLVNECPRQSFFAMAQHASQWVWFRKLFVTFSSYTFVNTLKKIN